MKEKIDIKKVGNIILKIAEIVMTCFILPLLLSGVTDFNDKIDELETFKTEMTVKMDNISEEVKSVNEDMVSKEKFSNMEKEFSNLSDDFSDLEDSVSNLKDDLMAEIEEIRPYVGVVYKIHESVIGSLFSTSNYAMGEIEGLKNLQWTDSQEIAINVKTGKKYTAKQLVERPLLIPYTYEGKEVYFVGQYNENKQWDGKCIFNVYQGNELEVITEATYENGILKEYKQVYDFVTEQGNKVWAVSNRIKKEGFSSGETTTYIKNDEWTKHFNTANVTYGDILTVEQLGMNVTARIEGYYNGNIAGGSFSDNTGNAYWVKYTAEGLVRYLYQGKVSEGNFNDDTGNAWYIIRGEEGKYIYYKGRFQDGERIDEGYESDITQERINEIIADKNFECELKWSVEQQNNL